MTRDSTGRICMQLYWNPRNFHLLGSNFNLAFRILKTLTKKLSSDQTKQVNDVFIKQKNKRKVALLKR